MPDVQYREELAYVRSEMRVMLQGLGGMDSTRDGQVTNREALQQALQSYTHNLQMGQTLNDSGRPAPVFTTDSIRNAHLRQLYDLELFGLEDTNRGMEHFSQTLRNPTVEQAREIGQQIAERAVTLESVGYDEERRAEAIGRLQGQIATTLLDGSLRAEQQRLPQSFNLDSDTIRLINQHSYDTSMQATYNIIPACNRPERPFSITPNSTVDPQRPQIVHQPLSEDLYSGCLVSPDRMRQPTPYHRDDNNPRQTRT